MIHFEPVQEPSGFDEKCRKPGNKWLEKHPPPDKPPGYWSPFKRDLADGFRNLCGYSCMYEPIGTVDHYLCQDAHRDLAYEWSNYRFVSGWINSSKQKADEKVFDPFGVEDGWFEILLPSLQLVVTNEVPEEHESRAAFTLERLHLRDDERVLRQRREWYRMYTEKELTIEGLRKKAPLLALAVVKQGEAGG